MRSVWCVFYRQEGVVRPLGGDLIGVAPSRDAALALARQHLSASLIDYRSGTQSGDRWSVPAATFAVYHHEVTDSEGYYADDGDFD